MVPAWIELSPNAELSTNLLYHYFDSKDLLFVAVMEQAYLQMREHQKEWSFADLEPEDAIERLVLYTFDHFVEQPTVISLLNSENLHKARHIAQSSAIPRLYDPLLQTIGICSRAVKNSKNFRDNVDPIDLYITISGLSYFYLSKSLHTFPQYFSKTLQHQMNRETTEACGGCRARLSPEVMMPAIERDEAEFFRVPWLWTTNRIWRSPGAVRRRHASRFYQSGHAARRELGR